MFEGASHLIFENAKHLRKNMTVAETILWMYLKKGINDYKFRRLHPIGLYIADFYCHKAKLIIEIDGSIHNKPAIIESDKIRQQELERWGYGVIRFSNEQVIKNPEKVLNSIAENLTRKQFTKSKHSSNNGV